MIKAKPLAEFMAVGGYGLYRKFDVTRFVPGSFSHWESAERHFDAPDLFYNAGLSVKRELHSWRANPSARGLRLEN